MNSKNNDESKNLVKKFWLFIGWLVGSAGSISLLLSAVGFLVEHAYLERIGLTHTLYEATAPEYIVSGGKFLMGIIPLAVIGFFYFLFNFWWLSLAIIFVTVFLWRKKVSSEKRLIVVAILYAIWLTLIIPFFDRNSLINSIVSLSTEKGVTIFTFTTITAIVYFCIEILHSEKRKTKNLMRKYFERAPLFLLLICSVIALPYLRGRYAIQRNYPLIEPLAEDRIFFNNLVSSDPENSINQEKGSQNENWRLIHIGKEKAILLRVADGQIYVVSKNKIMNFRIIEE